MRFDSCAPQRAALSAGRTQKGRPVTELPCAARVQGDVRQLQSMPTGSMQTAWWPQSPPSGQPPHRSGTSSLKLVGGSVPGEPRSFTCVYTWAWGGRGESAEHRWLFQSGSVCRREQAALPISTPTWHAEHRHVSGHVAMQTSQPGDPTRPYAVRT